LVEASAISVIGSDGPAPILPVSDEYRGYLENGTAFGLTNAGIPLEPLLDRQGVDFDPRKPNWIGSPDRGTTVCVAHKDAAVQLLDDLATKQLAV